jgi:hypothetical protein
MRNPNNPPAESTTINRIVRLSALGFLLLFTGCASTTVFQSSFNSNAVGAPPSQNQAVGTINTSAGTGSSVLVVSPPPGASENWVKLTRPANQDALPTMLCNFSQLPGYGTYSLLAALYIPSGSGLATIEFDNTAYQIGFLHIDFLQNNTVRVNDDPKQIFGTFPRDRIFTISVTLNITPSSTTASMQLFGTGASGSFQYSVTPANVVMPYGAVKFWMGFPWTGSFDATDILVTYHPSS